MTDCHVTLGPEKSRVGSYYPIVRLELARLPVLLQYTNLEEKIRMSNHNALLAIVFMMGYVIQFDKIVWHRRVVSIQLGIQRKENYKAAKELADAIDLEP
jgi:hypothetical protein